MPSDANDDERSENNIHDKDESSNEDDEMEFVATYLDDSSDKELWQKLLEDMGSSFVDDSINEELGEHVIEEAIDDEEGIYEGKLVVDESINSDEGENGNDQDVDESNYSEEGIYEGELVVDESINSDEGENGGEEDVYSSDNDEESMDENEEEYGSDTHSEYSINSNFIDFETNPATWQQIIALPTSTVSQEQLVQLSEDVCSICFGEFELDQEIKVPPCKHIFHAECLNTWLENDRRCPCCRMSCITDVNQPDSFMITYDNFF